MATWSAPTDDRGDSREILARIQPAAAENTGPLYPQVVARLSAPFGANQTAYPAPDLRPGSPGSDLTSPAPARRLSQKRSHFRPFARTAPGVTRAGRMAALDPGPTGRGFSLPLRAGLQPAGNVRRNVLPPPGAGSNSTVPPNSRR